MTAADHRIYDATARRAMRLAAERDRLHEALGLIEQHARLDLSERGVAEAERYAVIARDALDA